MTRRLDMPAHPFRLAWRGHGDDPVHGLSGVRGQFFYLDFNDLRMGRMGRRELIYTGEALNVLMLAVLWQAVMDMQHGEGVCQMDAKVWVETVGREWVETLGIRRSGVSGLGHKRRRERPGLED